MITYENYPTEIHVHLKSCILGKIKGSPEEGYWYEPMFDAPSKTFKSIDDVKRNIEINK